MTFEDHGLSAGCWTGALQSDDPPAALCLVHRGKAVAQARLREAGPGTWSVAVDLPGSVIDRGCMGCCWWRAILTRSDRRCWPA
ncbi:hypothetical protein ACFSYD_05525 [Paracoccus aerius]